MSNVTLLLAGAAIEIPGTLQAVPYIKRLVQGYREVGLPIVQVIRLYHKDGSNVDLCRSMLSRAECE